MSAPKKVRATKREPPLRDPAAARAPTRAASAKPRAATKKPTRPARARAAEAPAEREPAAPRRAKAKPDQDEARSPTKVALEAETMHDDRSTSEAPSRRRAARAEGEASDATSQAPEPRRPSRAGARAPKAAREPDVAERAPAPHEERAPAAHERPARHEPPLRGEREETGRGSAGQRERPAESAHPPHEAPEQRGDVERDPEAAGLDSPRRRKVRRAASSADAWARRGVAPPAEPSTPEREPRGEAGRRSFGAGTRRYDEPPSRYDVRDAGPRDAPAAEFPPRRPEPPEPNDGSPRPERHPATFDESKIDPDVQKVIRRLVRGGHEAYLVGGCVRDLLLDRRPKDFDVATSARPEEVRELFRNSRIIGRRFRLVHVLFQGGKVIEVATFRRNPKDEADDPSRAPELLIRSDNAFGVAHEDAMRRDFTINALFYDESTRSIIDWVGGMGDIERRVVHTIGDPETRFREDPIRMLRALKFAGRLGLAITSDVYDAIVYCRDALALAARPRLSEEILRMLRGGAARRTTYLAWETGVLDVLLPELAGLLYDDDGNGPGARVWRLLDYLDRRHAEGVQLDDTVLWTVLLLEPLREACEGVGDRAAAASALLDPVIERLAVSRRFADAMRRIVAIIPRLASGKAGRFARTDLFLSAVDVTLADLYARGLPTAHVERLRGGGRQDRSRQPIELG